MLYSKALLQPSPHSLTPMYLPVYPLWKNMALMRATFAARRSFFGEVGVCLSLSSVGHPSLATPVLFRNLILLIQPEKRTRMESAKCCSVDLRSSFRCFFMVFISTMKYHRLRNTSPYAKSYFNILNRK